jgi:hypothetical protein
MRAITLWQPWASLVAEGIKTLETRPKQHPWRSAIGETIAIHAAARAVPEWSGGGYHVTHDAGSGERHLYAYNARRAFVGEAIDLPLGAVVATCRLVDVVPMVALEDEPASPNQLDVMPDRLLLWRQAFPYNVNDQRPFGDFAPGRWALLLDDVVKLTHPVPCRGYQGLWTLPREIEVAGLRVG